MLIYGETTLLLYRYMVPGNSILYVPYSKYSCTVYSALRAGFKVV